MERNICRTFAPTNSATLPVGTAYQGGTFINQEDEKLSGYVMTLQKFDKVLMKAQKTGKVTIERNVITDIKSATFEI